MGDKWSASTHELAMENFALEMKNQELNEEVRRLQLETERLRMSNDDAEEVITQLERQLRADLSRGVDHQKEIEKAKIKAEKEKAEIHAQYELQGKALYIERRANLLNETKYIIVSAELALTTIRDCLSSARPMPVDKRNAVSGYLSSIQSQFELVLGVAQERKRLLMTGLNNVALLPKVPPAPSMTELDNVLKAFAREALSQPDLTNLNAVVKNCLLEMFGKHSKFSPRKFPTNEAIGDSVRKIYLNMTERKTGKEIADLVAKDLRMNFKPRRPLGSKLKNFRPFKPQPTVKEHWDDEDCPICYDPMFDSQVLSKCRSCHNKIHQECVETWLVKEQTCPMCRINWPSDVHFPALC